MIRFNLVCDAGHEFDGWFRSNEDYEGQHKSGLVSCPTCHSAKVAKALMAPAVSTARKQEKIALAVGAEQRQILAKLKEMADHVRQNADYVGDKFADVARKIHFGEVERRGIYGEASVEEVKSLAEDGVDFMPLPTFPDEHN